MGPTYEPGMVHFGGRRHVKREGSKRYLCGRRAYRVVMDDDQRTLHRFALAKDACKQCVAALAARSLA